MRASISDACGRVASTGSGSRSRRVAAALALVACCAACAPASATAFTLRIVFPDGKPMTYGSACAGLGCLQDGHDVRAVDERGQVVLPDGRATIEYRRDGIDLGLAPIHLASGRLLANGDRATVILPRTLSGIAPAVDAAESDLVARLNEARVAHGLPAAQLNPSLSAAADFQATWLAQSGVLVTDPGRFHSGPFDSDLAFRHGEVSLPDPASGGEIAQAGGTLAEALADWMASPDHRDLILTPGRLLVGAAQVGPFTIVQTHPPCRGCPEHGTGTRLDAPPATTPVAALAPAVAPTTAASAAPAPVPSCGRERLAIRRLRGVGGRVRLRVTTRCLRTGARYALVIRQGSAGRMLRTVRIWRARTITLRLRPSKRARELRIRLKRDRRVIVARTMSLRM